MSNWKKVLSAAAMAAVAATGALTVAASPASARVVCNADGDCWHTDRDYHYRRDVRVEVHPDSWYFHQNWSDHNRRYHEHHDDRGYYRGGTWVAF